MPIQPNLASALDGHPLMQVAQWLADYLGIGSDPISLLLYLSRAAGRLRCPVHVVIKSDAPVLDHHIVDRIIELSPAPVRRLNSIGEIRELEEDKFQETEVVLCRGNDESLHRFGCEVTSKCYDDLPAPSIWWTTDAARRRPTAGPTVSVTSEYSQRCVEGFGRNFARWDAVPQPSDANGVSAESHLHHALDQLEPGRAIACPFEADLRAPLRPDESLVVHRLLRVVAALRCNLPRAADQPIVVEPGDYLVVRNLLAALPVTPMHSQLPPYALETANAIYAGVSSPQYQLTVPDHSELGQKNFTRREVERWADISYGTAKAHLDFLEAAGIVRSSVRINSRRQGMQIYYGMAAGRTPPFDQLNPFTLLPPWEQIARDDNPPPQS